MTDSIIKYDELVQKALIGVVRNLLSDTVKNGLPGEHHFYITFQTKHPGVKIPSYLKERYEEDMTIVLQNQFWDLAVDEEHFEIALSFNRNKEHLYIPFDSLLGFFDPSVDFGLHFNSEVAPTVEISEEKEPELKTKTEKLTQNDENDKNDVVQTTGKDNIVTLDAFRKKK